MGSIAIGNRIGRRVNSSQSGKKEKYISFTTAKQSLTIPVTGIVGLFEINYGDGTVDTLKENNVHNYASLGTNTVIITAKEKEGSLVRLTLSRLEITSIDLSNPFILKELPCSSNKLSEIDLSKLPLLEILSVATNPIASLDLRKNPKLLTLYIGSTRITSLDFSKNIDLTLLDMLGSILIENLDFTNNPKLNSVAFPFSINETIKTIDFSGTSITTFSSSTLAALRSLKFNNCKSLKTLYVSKSELETLELQNLPELTSLQCLESKLTNINTGSGLRLTYVNLSKNRLTTIDINDFNPFSLDTFNCSDNLISGYDFGVTNYKIKNLNVSGNLITSLNLRGMSGFISLNASNNPNLIEIKNPVNFPNLTSVNFDNCTSLPQLVLASADKIESVSLKNLPALTNLYLRYLLELKSLEIVNVPNVSLFSFTDNLLIKNISLTEFPKLETFDASQGGLTALDVTSNLELKTLTISYTPLSKNTVNLIATANSLPVRTSTSTGTLNLSASIPSEVKSICDLKNWRIS